MVGGSTFIPRINQLVKDFFKDSTATIWNTIDGNEVVAHGAAIYAAVSNAEASLNDHLWSYQRAQLNSSNKHLALPKPKIGSTHAAAMFKILMTTLPKARISMYAPTNNFIQEFLDEIKSDVLTDDTKTESANPNFEKSEMIKYLQTEPTNNIKNGVGVNIDTNGLSEFELWLTMRSQSLETVLKRFLKQGPDNFDIDTVIISNNKELTTKFLTVHENIQQDFKNSIFLFRPTSLENISGNESICIFFFFFFKSIRPVQIWRMLQKIKNAKRDI
ncbi:hypothetical protein RFI_33029 [Reticulomyxa filosa]|uniref:Uncharacterized protein n=1 Tax=Reticulomyxa filosa TaxID=46433 RepID=X6LTG0_RETFI|nr:hypothetical protein RFI_33029 [Reticulomyxa filosa]|eukprot:ETO04367.1 hypothetical protein RFI_33029 [Reticulomyxa filosa]